MSLFPMLRKKKWSLLGLFPPSLIKHKICRFSNCAIFFTFLQLISPESRLWCWERKGVYPVSQHLQRGGCSFWGSASQSSGLFQHCFEIISKLATLSTKPRFALFHGKNFFPFWLKGLNLDEEGKARNSDYFFLMKKYKQLSTTSSFMLDKTYAL